MQFTGTIIENQILRGRYFRLTLQIPSGTAIPKPGQFFQVRIPKRDQPWLRIPLSIMDAEGDRLRFMVRIEGEGTLALSTLDPGDELDIVGPLGRGFDIPTKGSILLVSGGIGYPALSMLRKWYPGRTRWIHGGRSAEDVFEADSIFTDDGSAGRKGPVTTGLEDRLRQGGIDLICACGPDAMLAACTQIAGRFNVPIQVSMEAWMACGFGVCHGCAIRVKENGNEVVRLVCKDGPVFDGQQVIWQKATGDTSLPAFQRSVDPEENPLSARLGRLKLKNPVTVASGTFGKEFEGFYDLSKLGALVTKTITPEPRAGNTSPRLYETEHGLLNSIGLQNPGLEGFITETLPLYRNIDTPLLVSVSASSESGFAEMIQRLEECSGIAGYEINVSCPNVEREGIAFGTEPDTVHSLTTRLRACTDRELIIKLTPNVTDIVSIACAAEKGGADSVALINTLMGMAIAPLTGRSRIPRGIAGYSGPAIKPVAVQCVYRVSRIVKIPVLAMGGIGSWLDALEFFRAGASVVAVGTSAFVEPALPEKIVKKLEQYFRENNCRLNDIIGRVTGIQTRSQ